MNNPAKQISKPGPGKGIKIMPIINTGIPTSSAPILRKYLTNVFTLLLYSSKLLA